MKHLKKNKKILKISLAIQMLSIFSCHADTAIIVGGGFLEFNSNAADYVIGNSLPLQKTISNPLSITGNIEGGLYSVAIDSKNGNIVASGFNTDGNVLACQGSVATNTLSPIPIDTIEGILLDTAFDYNHQAILVGFGTSPVTAIAYRWIPATAQLIPIDLGSTPPNSGLLGVAFFSDNTAILVGGSDTTPVVYLVPPNSNTATLVSVPNPDIVGSLKCVAVGANGIAFMGGVDTTNNRPLIYKMSNQTFTLSNINTSDSGDETELSCVAITSEGTAVFGGGSLSRSLAYKVPKNSTEAIALSFPTENTIRLLTAVTGGNNITLLGGFEDETGIPCIYQLPPNSSSLISISITDPPSYGAFTCSGIGNDGTVAMGGVNEEENFLLYKMPINSNSASRITVNQSYPYGLFYGMAIYSSEKESAKQPLPMYDLTRIQNHYSKQKKATIKTLKKHGVR